MGRQGSTGISVLKAKLECRCSAALATEAQPASTSAFHLAQVPAGTLRIGQQKRSDRRDVESLEALWNPISNDDGHAALERLQSAVAAQGTPTGLNGNIFVLRSLSSVCALEQGRESSFTGLSDHQVLKPCISAICFFHLAHA